MVFVVVDFLGFVVGGFKLLLGFVVGGIVFVGCGSHDVEYGTLTSIHPRQPITYHHEHP